MLHVEYSSDWLQGLRYISETFCSKALTDDDDWQTTKLFHSIDILGAFNSERLNLSKTINLLSYHLVLSINP